MAASISTFGRGLSGHEISRPAGNPSYRVLRSRKRTHVLCLQRHCLRCGRSEAEIYPGSGMWETRETVASITDFSGSMRNVQIKAPASRTPAEIKKGAIHNPL